MHVRHSQIIKSREMKVAQIRTAQSRFGSLRIPSFTKLAKTHRRNAEDAVQMVGEVTLVGEAYSRSHFVDREPCISQERLCTFDPSPDHVLMN